MLEVEPRLLLWKLLNKMINFPAVKIPELPTEPANLKVDEII